MKIITCMSLILICALQVSLATNSMFPQDAAGNIDASFHPTGTAPAMPDLIVRGNEFEFVDDKKVNVYVSNNGDAASITCVLELTVRKIGNASVGRKVKATIPSIPPGKFVKVLVNASGILPASVSLKDTTFKVVADSTNSIAESNENNNEKWHNQ